MCTTSILQQNYVYVPELHSPDVTKRPAQVWVGFSAGVVDGRSMYQDSVSIDKYQVSRWVVGIDNVRTSSSVVEKRVRKVSPKTKRLTVETT